ncbi:uracil-DNA glycosylase family protein [Mesorhizobium sp. SP-1A]|uniref:uracil-DNA glycosylase family protein n=1 Tax=Mesorhizobium sp. SP-1A TaxID=3077840 RepID=UPI0028F6DED9|nr:uracil-DNA glycosylase family protein [Mesorhizobium sp. SP-1A]
MANDILTDLIRPDLKLVICGSAAGTASAERNAYYAGRGNRFWKIMQEIGLPGDRQLDPEEWRRLDEYDIGLTDLAKNHFGMDNQLPAGCYDNQRLQRTIEEAQPAILALQRGGRSSTFSWPRSRFRSAGRDHRGD